MKSEGSMEMSDKNLFGPAKIFVKTNGYIFRAGISVRIVFVSLLKRVYSKRKKFFSFTVDPYSEEVALYTGKQTSHKVVSLFKKMAKKLPGVSSPRKTFLKMLDFICYGINLCCNITLYLSVL